MIIETEDVCGREHRPSGVDTARRQVLQAAIIGAAAAGIGMGASTAGAATPECCKIYADPSEGGLAVRARP